jgi:hypothetical protein
MASPPMKARSSAESDLAAQLTVSATEASGDHSMEATASDKQTANQGNF